MPPEASSSEVEPPDKIPPAAMPPLPPGDMPATPPAPPLGAGAAPPAPAWPSAPALAPPATEALPPESVPPALSAFAPEPSLEAQAPRLQSAVAQRVAVTDARRRRVLRPPDVPALRMPKRYARTMGACWSQILCMSMCTARDVSGKGCLNVRDEPRTRRRGHAIGISPTQRKRRSLVHSVGAVRRQPPGGF